MTTKKLISKRYIFLSAILLVLAGGLVLLPKFEKHEGIDPQELLSNVISPERYISTDLLADKLINQDPTYLLIDVRDEESFNKNTLPNAINIPLSKLLDEDSNMYLDQDAYNIVFFSNDNFYADQAWALCTRLDYKNLHVLKGGINEWFNTIIKPVKPTENMPSEAFKLYSFRKAASMYYGVVYPEQFKPKVVVKKAPPKKTIKRVVTVKKKKKAPAEGGC